MRLLYVVVPIPPELFHGKSISDLEESPEEPDSLNANNS